LEQAATAAAEEDLEHPARAVLAVPAELLAEEEGEEVPRSTETHREPEEQGLTARS
jgi:hypothetical protein